MKAAFSIARGRIAPVFDVARHIRLVESDADTMRTRGEYDLPDTTPAAKVAQLEALGAELLVCGAVSRPLHELLTARGIVVAPFVAGEAEAVMAAWANDTLDDESFAMPGCCGRRRGWRGGGAAAEALVSGSAATQSSTTARACRRGRQQAAGDARNGVCVCPQCGYTRAHRPGEPCMRAVCPECGTPLVRSDNTG
ncbi:MAG: hypothetical protein ACLFTT_11130 [Candidatus Hydrogenedentota bacterium]